MSSAHWLKNWVFYGDPFYPLLHAYLPSHPFHEGAAKLLNRFYWAPEFVLRGTPSEKILKTLRVLFTFAFEPHDWGFHGQTPVFGALFTLLLLTLPFTRPPLRLWLLVAGVHIGIAFWFFSSHQDRFLQALLPWMAASTAAMLVLAWRRGKMARGLVATLVGLQVVWGGDVYFFRTHSMIGDAPIKAAVDFLSAGHRRQYEERFRLWGNLQDLGLALPKGAKVLGHDWTEKLGMGAESVSDRPGFQGAIDYLLLDSPDKALALWRELGVTHAWWLPRGGYTPPDLMAREVVFQRAAYEHTRETRDFGQYRLAAIVSSPRDSIASERTRIAWLTCGDGAPMGIYVARGLALNRSEARLDAPTLSSESGNPLAPANSAVVSRSCAEGRSALERAQPAFKKVKDVENLEIWLRTIPSNRAN